MNLEIKHLAPYLPYGLKVQCKRHWIKYGEQHTLEVNGIAKSDEWQYEFYNGGNLMFADITAKGFKPILRPLSQLTETIEHNGEKFVPYHRLLEYLIYKSYDGVRLYQNRINTNTLYWSDAQMLFEWHFDVFGLIENNLAIAVTDELNPYK